MTSRNEIHLAPALVLALLASCTKAPAPDSARDSAGANGTVTTLTFSAAQVEHGKVRWARATAGTIGANSTVPGELVPNEDHTARLGAASGGQVLDVSVQPGDRVTRGQPLVRLQSPGAGMAQADLTRATAEVASRRAQMRYAESARGRSERLLALKSISQQEYERAVVDADQARNGLAQAESEERRAHAVVGQLGAGGSKPGEVVLRAPMAGVVLTRSALPGTVVEAGAPLVTITDPTTLWLTIAAPEPLIPLFRQGGRVRFAVPAFPADTFTALIDAVGAALDVTTRTLPVRGVVANRDGRLKAAMLATVTVAGTGIKAGVLIPEDAVQLIQGVATVFIAHPDGKGGALLDRREVTVGPHQGGLVAILRGLSPSDTVVVAGAFAIKSEFLKGGMPAMDM